MDRFSTEIRTFYSLKEIQDIIDSEIAQYKSLFEDYSQWLGSLLRNPESAKNQELTKKTAELQRLLKAGSRRGNKKEEKKAVSSSEWVQFKDVMVSGDVFGEAEILFEAIEDLKNKIGCLEKAKNSIIDLERYGLGKDLLFVTYIHDGVPEKIVFKPKKDENAVGKFEFAVDFSLVKHKNI